MSAVLEHRTRLEGWETRLNAVIESARNVPYQLGSHDCLRVACAAVEALIGVDHWPKFAGRYRSRREAMLVIGQYGRSLGAAVIRILDAPAESMRLARRGDIALYRDEEGEHLGVCVGRSVAVLGPDGLVFVPLLDAGLQCCWRVG